jgi:large subunit ribosomal protein L22
MYQLNKMIREDYNKENMAKVSGRALGISTRHAMEISDAIRGKNLQKSKEFLQRVLDGKTFVKFKRFNKGVGHKPGLGPARSPMNATKEILDLLKSAESNAQFKGLNTANLVIGFISANNAGNSWHYGRQRRRRMKRTNIEIILIEKGAKKELKKENQQKEPQIKKESESKKEDKETKPVVQKKEQTEEKQKKEDKK